MKQQLCIIMGWESNLTVNDRYTRGTRPRLRPEVQAWQQELAWNVKVVTAHRAIEWAEWPALIVDVEMRFPDDGVDRDADNYLKSIFDGLEMGLGIPDSRFIPFVRAVQVRPALQAGFTIRVYPSTLAGHGLFGRVSFTIEGVTVIVLEQPLPSEWLNERVCINLGMVMEED